MKNIVTIEKYCYDWKILLQLKNIVIIEKYCYNWKILYQGSFIFFHEKISHAQKAQKTQNANKQLLLSFFCLKNKTALIPSFILLFLFIIAIRGHSKSTFVEEERRDHWKANKNEQGEGVLACLYVRFLKKNILRFSKWSFTVILQFFLLLIMAVWNIKQTILTDYNIPSCQWIACDRFRQPTQDHQRGLC